jgi:PAS domain S-box-containing protein
MAADSIPITPHSPTKPVFDYMVMQKFGLEEASLPQSSILLNKPFSFYNTYKLFIWFGFVVVFILIILVLILFINVIKRRAAQKTLIENERKYRTLVETVPQGIIEVDKDLIITFANSALRKNFDLWDLDLIGKSIYKFISSDQAEILRNRFSNILEQRVNFPQYSGSYRTIKGKSLYVQLDWSYKRNADGNIVGFISVVSDITQRIKAEKEAKIRQEQLIQADKMVALGTLVSGMAHEINNPNNFILINIPILRKVWKSVLPILDSYFQKNNDFYVARFPYKVIREDYFEICSNILAGTNRIKSIVNDLKEYSRKDVGELIENIAINNVVTSCINLLGNNINKYTNHLHLDLAKKLPAVRGNFRHFEQILINLIQNACQSLRSKTDPVSIKTCLQNGRVEIHIIDKGIGISKENISRIFDPFYTTKRNEGGTGLGLSVSNSLVQKYEGELRFNSIENDGTTAVVSFPAINKVTE